MNGGINRYANDEQGNRILLLTRQLNTRQNIENILQLMYE